MKKDDKKVVKKYKETTQKQKEILIRLVTVDSNSIRDAAHITGINESTARSILCAYRKNGNPSNIARGGNNKIKVTDDVCKKIEEVVEHHPDMTLKQIKKVLEAEGMLLSISSIFNALVKLGITFSH